MTATLTKPKGPGSGVYARPPRCTRCDEPLDGDVLTRLGQTHGGEEIRLDFCGEECETAYVRAWEAIRAVALEEYEQN